MRKRLLLLGVLGVFMTLAVAGAALVSLQSVSATNRELARVTRALHFHQHADMMHDALRADVARAQLVDRRAPGYVASDVRSDTELHVRQFRDDLEALADLHLPRRLSATLEGLRQEQEAYIRSAQGLVDSALSGRRGTLTEQASYEAAYQSLIPTLGHGTDQLMKSARDAKRAAAAETSDAMRVISLSTVAALAGWVALVAWHNRSMRNLQAALLREAEQRSAAELLQRSLLPTHLPEVPGVALAARTVPGSADQQVGGDWYDVLTLPTGEVCLVVGDVVGHDLPAAALMGQVRNALRAYALEDPSPTTILGRVNRAACLLDASDLTTCICVVLDPATMTVRWSSAGHPPPLALSSTGRGRLLDGEPGPPLGVDPGARYPQHETRLRPGQNLLLYTDGLVERRGATIDDGLSALRQVVVPRSNPQEMCDRVIAALPNDTSHRDDVTCLLLHVEPQHPVRAAAVGQTSAWETLG
jgi:serine phosphatase RsbU (regulator of sigma subunit)